MAVKKSVLYSKLWDSCNTLRSKGGMDATQYKDYVLIILFMKVITDKYYHKKGSLIEVPDDANFNTMIALKGKKNIGEEFNKILAKIAEENDLQNVIDVVDFNDENKLGKGKDMIDALTGLVEVFQDPELDFSNNRADDNDVLGDAYEYLMKQFASEAGKSKGQFYTPSEVSRVMSKILKIDKCTKSPIEVYDMACGSGSLLIKAGNEAREDKKVYLYGQEKDTNTAGLCVMNMFLHGNATADIKDGNTLTNPRHLENGNIKTFDFCVANPPFSVKKWNTDLGADKEFGRFTGFGMPPENCADYAFLLHMLKAMEPINGRGAIILPHGVLFRGGQEEVIRKNLLKSGYIEGIIGLPSNLFYGTGIPACIVVLDKKDAENRKSIFIIDASKCFIKDGNKNKLREKDIKKITETYINRIEEEKYSRNVSMEEIEKEDYNLNIPRYIDSSEEGIIQDIKAHILGGLPERDINKLNKYWDIAPSLKNELFNKNEKEGYYNLSVTKDEINDIINDSKELKEYFGNMQKKVSEWENNNKESLLNVNNDTRVRDLIAILSNSILEIFTEDKLVDKYDAYEYLMEYYNTTLKDDLHLIIENGWKPKLVFGQDKKGNIKKNEFESDLLPKDIVIREFYRNDFETLENANNELNTLIQEFESKIEENTGDEDANALFSEDEKVNEKLLKEKIKEETEEKIVILKELLKNLDDQKEEKKIIKERQEDLNEKIISKYNELSENEFKELIVNSKWIKSIREKFDNHKNTLINNLARFILKLDEEYELTLGDLNKNIESQEHELAKLLNELDGDVDEIKAFNELIEQLGGNNDE